MKIVVINAYKRQNAGDAALLSVCLRQIRIAFPEASIGIAGMESPDVYADFENVPNLGSIKRYVADGSVSRLIRIVRRALIAAWAVHFLILPPQIRKLLLRMCPTEVSREAAAVGEADLVVSMGGGYLSGRGGLNGYQNVFFVLLPVLIAYSAGTPVVFGPQSYGPFSGHLQRRFVGYVLNRVALVVAREQISVDELQRCGVLPGVISRGVDSAFALRASSSVRGERVARDWRGELAVEDNEVLIGITARRYLAPPAQERYERAIVDLIDLIQDQPGHRVVLIPQVTTDYLGDDDRLANRAIAQACRTVPIVIEASVDYHELRSLYGRLHLLIGTRFHSVIFALLSGTPCIAIAYEHKTRGIMSDLGLTDWVLAIEDVTTEKLWHLVTELEQQRDVYIDKLDAAIPGYVERAENFVTQLREVMRSTIQETDAILEIERCQACAGADDIVETRSPGRRLRMAWSEANPREEDRHGR